MKEVMSFWLCLRPYRSLLFCKDETVEPGESIWGGAHNYIFKHLKNKIPVLSYEYDLDWYTLYSDREGGSHMG